MKSLTITLFPKSRRHELSDPKLCSLEGKNIYGDLIILWNSEKFSHREIYRVLLTATKMMNLAE